MDVLAGSTDVTTYFQLSLLADGADATGLTITNIDLQYTRTGEVPTAKVDATALAATNTAHTDNYAIEIDATDQPGLYRVDWPDAAFASGAREVFLTVKCALVKTQTLRVNLTPVPANVTQIGSDAQSATDLKDFADAGYDPSTNKVQGLVLADAVTTVNGLAAGVITAASTAGDFVTEIQTAITGGAYDLNTDANGSIRIVDGTGTGEINTNSGAIALVDLVTDITTKTGYRLSATGIDDIWDEPLAAHTTADTPGNVLNMLTQDSVVLSTDVAIGSIIGQILDDGTTWDYSRTDSSLHALRQRGDAAWITNTATSIRSAVGLASANLDTQLDALPTATEVRNAVTGGAYALNTDANGSIRIVDGTGTGELDTLSGTVLLRSATEAAIASILDDTGTSGVILTSGERDSVADALLDRTSGIESGVTPRQAFRGMAAILAGIISGAGTGTEVFKGIGLASGGTTRVTVTVDSSGNRSALALNL